MNSKIISSTYKNKHNLTQKILKDSGICVGNDESVRAGVKVGNINVDFLVLYTRNWTDLGHE